MLSCLDEMIKICMSITCKRWMNCNTYAHDYYRCHLWHFMVSYNLLTKIFSSGVFYVYLILNLLVEWEVRNWVPLILLCYSSYALLIRLVCLYFSYMDMKSWQCHCNVYMSSCHYMDCKQDCWQSLVICFHCFHLVCTFHVHCIICKQWSNVDHLDHHCCMVHRWRSIYVW